MVSTHHRQTCLSHIRLSRSIGSRKYEETKKIHANLAFFCLNFPTSLFSCLRNPAVRKAKHTLHAVSKRLNNLLFQQEKFTGFHSYPDFGSSTNGRDLLCSTNCGVHENSERLSEIRCSCSVRFERSIPDNPRHSVSFSSCVAAHFASCEKLVKGGNHYSRQFYLLFVEEIRVLRLLSAASGAAVFDKTTFLLIRAIFLKSVITCSAAYW